MESVIAGLLNDFENGKMTRRQLIQSLALAAVAAAPAATVVGTDAAAPAAPMHARAVEDRVAGPHLLLRVRLQEEHRLLHDLMGWDVQNDNGTNQSSLDIGNVGGIIIRNRRAPAEGPPTSPAASRSRRSAESAADHRRHQSHLVRHSRPGTRKR